MTLGNRWGLQLHPAKQLSYSKVSMAWNFELSEATCKELEVEVAKDQIV